MLVADAAGEKLLSATFAHDEQGLRALCRTLVRLEVVLVAIERPDGLLVECKVARTDSHHFGIWEPDSDATKALRALARAREDLVGTPTTITNQLLADRDHQPAARGA